MHDDQQIQFNNRIDHDLLIRIDTKMDLLTKQFNSHQAEAIGRIKSLEDHKIDKAEILRLKHEADIDHKDFETRMRRVERWGFVAIGGLAILQLFISVAY